MIDIPELGEIADFDHLEPHETKQVRRIVVEIMALALRHDAGVQLTCLVVIGQKTLVMVMALAGDDIVCNSIGRLRRVWPELVLEGVWHILRVSSVVGIIAGPTVEIERGIRASHERTVYGDWVKIHADAVVLCIAIEEHAELEKRILDCLRYQGPCFQARRLLVQCRGESSRGLTLVTSKGSKPRTFASASSGCMICTFAVHSTSSPLSMASHSSRFE